MTESIRSAFSSVMGRFKNSRLARMSSGHYCLIRDLGLVKGGKGLRHHEVVIDFSWRGLWRFLFPPRPVLPAQDAGGFRTDAAITSAPGNSVVGSSHSH
ncbi:hypothetical protein JQ616_07560 [Bradyrhizobium tropiciagri]|nr:hypothetical protein [Bradyrhizobium tropiciagri]